MQRLALANIQSGTYAKEWVNAHGKHGRNAVTEPLRTLELHPNEIIGRQVRRIMWPNNPVE